MVEGSWHDMRLRAISVVCGVVFLLCLAAIPVIDYLGGRSCGPLSILLFPAEIVPFGIGLITFFVLVTAVILSLARRRDRPWTLSAMAVVVLVTAAYRTWAGQLPGFLEGLRDRFVAQVGYPKMREFAREVLARSSVTSTEGVMQPPDMFRPASDEQKRAWNALVSRYPFLGWRYGARTVLQPGGIVESYWGSALVGHWGFQVAPDGAVEDLEENEGRVLRVAEDIQFVYYWD